MSQTRQSGLSESGGWKKKFLPCNNEVPREDQYVTFLTDKAGEGPSLTWCRKVLTLPLLTLQSPNGSLSLSPDPSPSYVLSLPDIGHSQGHITLWCFCI